MSVTGIDIAWERPTIAEIKAAGAHWVARYFSADTTKNLHAAEVTAYRAAGLGTVVVWETTARRATAGHTAGVADAQAAEVQRKTVGLPPDMVLHFAVDTDTSWAAVQPYFDGVASVIGLARTGCYGGIDVITGAYAHGIHYLWQTGAWSEGQWSPHATIRQTGGTTLAGGADRDQAQTPDFGQYPRPAAPHKPPAPKCQPYPGTAFFTIGRRSPIVAAMHARLIAVGCNHYRSSANKDVIGTGDEASYEAWQRKYSTTHHKGWTGPALKWPPGKETWDALQVPHV